MEGAMLADAPKGDREEIERYIESHGGAIVLRCNGKLGSEAQREFIAYKKAHDYEDPPFDFVWIGEAMLGVAREDQIEAAIRELRAAAEAREEWERLIPATSASLVSSCASTVGGAASWSAAASALL